MSNTYTTPTLYAYDKSKRIKMWKGSVTEEGDKSVIKFEFGLEEGKKQIQTKDITKGKNIGKVNETTPFQQAVKDVNSKMNKKRDSGYGEDKDNIETPILPMLALSFDSRKHNIKYPCYVQPKIDGVRMTCRLVDGRIDMFTRKGKEFRPLPELELKIKELFDSIDEQPDTFYLDGELFSDTLTFQELAGIVRSSKSTPQQLVQVKYVVFDCFDTDLPTWDFESRNDFIKQMINDELKPNTNNPSVVRIPTCKVDEETLVYRYNKLFLDDGYEGTIIRNTHGQYILNHRSPDLQKLKTFVDDEFQIVGFSQGTGTDKGCVIWDCRTDDGQVFSVRPRGSVAERQGYFQNGEKFIGSKLTIRYQELTDDGIPRFPVGITVRDYE